VNVGSSTSSAVIGAMYEVAVQRKQLDAQEQLGKGALELVEAAGERPVPAPNGKVGTLIDIVA
jgi:hypothetical protein